MKKPITVLLLFVLLIQVCPFDALAAVGKVLTREELDRAYALTGLGEDEGVYHNGMKPNASWSAAQLSDWLEDMLTTTIHSISDTLSRADYALSELREKDEAAYRQLSSGNFIEKLHELSEESEALQEEMRYYKKHLQECSGLIAEMRFALIDQEKTLFDSEKVRMSARIEEAVAELSADREYIIDHIDTWKERANALQRYLSLGPLGDDEDEPFMGNYLQRLFGYSQPVSNTAKASLANGTSTRLARLSADAGLSANDAVDTHITVITDQQICFSLFTNENGKRKPLPGISLEVKDILNPDMWDPPHETDEDGLVILPTNLFTTDQFDVIHLKLTVDGESKGYRSLYIDDLDLELGDRFDLTMIPLDAGDDTIVSNAGGQPYIVSGEFNKRDIMYSDYNMLYSSANNYPCEIKVEVKNAEGLPELMMSWYENDGSLSNLKRCWAKATTHEGNVYTFVGPWKQKFSPNASKAQRPAFSFGQSPDAVRFVSRLVSTRSATDKPLNEGTGSGGGVFGSVLGTGISLGATIPLGGDKSVNISLNLPFLDYLPKFSTDLAGYVVMYCGSDVLEDIVKGAKANWQSRDLKDLKRAQTYVEKETGFANYKSQFGLAYDYYREKGWKLLGESTLKFGVYGVATARWELDNKDPDVKTKLITARAGLGFTVTYAYSWTFSYPVGGVPVNITFTLGVSAGFALPYEFNFCWVNGGFQNWNIRPVRELTISVGLSFTARLGVGIKGFLEGYVRFNASLNLLIHLYLWEKEPSNMALTYACSLTAGFTVFFVDTSFTWVFKKGQLWPKQNSANLLAHYMSDSSNAGGEVVEAAHQEPMSYPDLVPEAKELFVDAENVRPDLKVAKAGKWTYAFYIKETKAKNGRRLKRVHWLNVDNGQEGSLQADLDSSDYPYPKDMEILMQDKHDYSYDVRATEDFICLFALCARDFDKNGYPKPNTGYGNYVINTCYYVMVLQPDASGRLSHRLSVKDGNNRNFCMQVGKVIAGDVDIHNYSYDSMADVRISHAEVAWENKAQKKVKGFHIYGQGARIAYEKDVAPFGSTAFSYCSDVWGKQMNFYTDKELKSSMGNGYARSQIHWIMMGQDALSELDATRSSWPSLVALTVPKDGGDAARGIEMYQYAMNMVANHKQNVPMLLKKGDIDYIVAASARSNGKTHTTVFYTQTEYNSEGVAQNRLYGLNIGPCEGSNGNKDLEIDVTECCYDVTLPTNRFEVGYIGAIPYLYWLTSGPKGEDVDKTVWRIWAVAYDPTTNTMSDASVFAQFELPKTIIDGEPRRMFDPMTGEWIVKPEKKVCEVVPADVLLTSSGTGYLIGKAMETSYGEKMPRTMLLSFPEQMKPVANLQSAVPQDMAIKAGDFEDIDVGVMNAGNLALATFDVELREVDDAGNEGIVVETVHVNMIDPSKSKVTLAKGEVVLQGKQVAHRAEDYDYSPRQRDFIVSRETRAYKLHLSLKADLESADVIDNDTKHLTSGILMPGSLGDFLASFKIPEDWEGKKKLRLRISRISVESNWLRRMANAGGIISNAVANDGDESVELVYLRDPATGKLVLQRPAVSNGVVNNAIASGLFANVVDGGDAVDIIVDIHDISVSHRVYMGWDGQDWVDINIHDRAVTGEALKLSCAVYLDGAETPRYMALPYYEAATSDRRTHNIAMPVSALVGDTARHDRARVVITAVGKEESVYANNEFTLYLDGNDPLHFEKQPEDVTVQAGEDVSFTVEVAGGAEPYTYQWQIWDPNKERWVDLPGFTDPVLSRKDIEKKWDGCRFRCVVTDAEGTQIVSQEVTLSVRDRVPTGDDSNLPLYLAIALAALALLWWMRRRTRKGL